MFWKTLQLWACYYLSFWPAVPGFGSVADADCLFVQAFGRNDYTDDELGKVIFRLRTEAKLDDLETLALLKQAGFRAGKSNSALASYAMRLHNQLGNVPIISQWEVLYAAYDLDPVWVMENINDLDFIWPPEEGYFATAHVKSMSKRMMEARGCNKPLEVAHPAMITRAVPIIWGCGVTPIVEEISKGEEHELWVWDEESVQPWTRNWDSWKTREFVGRVAHVVSHLFGLVGILPLVRNSLPSQIRKQLPGDWIAFWSPKTI